MSQMISIVVPVYNAEQYIEQCISSILKQTYQNIELILINDGSKDKSLDVCLKYNYNEKVRIIDKENGGVSSARNRGILEAKGTYITFVDSDDYIEEDYCEVLVSSFDKYNTDMVVCGISRTTDKNKIKIEGKLKDGYYNISDIKAFFIDQGNMTGFTFPSACAVLYKRDLILENNIRFNENVKFNEDGLFNCEYLFHARSLYVDYSHYIYFYRVNEASATSTVDIRADKFTGSMTIVHDVLMKYAEKFPDYEVKEQLVKREISIVVDRLIYLIKIGEKKKELLVVIKKLNLLLKNMSLDLKKLPSNKVLLFVLVKFQLVLGLRVYIKLLIPFVKNMRGCLREKK